MQNITHKSPLREEIANSITHGIGALLSIAGLVFLIVLSNIYGDAWHIVSCSIYGATLIILYTASALYHGFQNIRVKRILKIIDHSAIYLLIAGSYTPFLLVNLRGPWGWSLFGLIWGMALAGVIFKLFFTGRFKSASTIIYLVMGWIVIFAVKPMLTLVPSQGLFWLVAGGLAYSLGVIFYVRDEKMRFGHAIWHLFVLSGSACHFFAVMFSIIPAALPF